MPDSRWLYCVTIAGVAIVAAGAIVILEVLAPGGNKVPIVRDLLVILLPTTVVLLGLIKFGEDVQRVHISVNSRMDELLKQAKLASLAEGRETGRAEGREARTTEGGDRAEGGVG